MSVNCRHPIWSSESIDIPLFRKLNLLPQRSYLVQHLPRCFPIVIIDLICSNLSTSCCLSGLLFLSELTPIIPSMITPMISRMPMMSVFGYWTEEIFPHVSNFSLLILKKESTLLIEIRGLSAGNKLFGFNAQKITVRTLQGIQFCEDSSSPSFRPPIQLMEYLDTLVMTTRPLWIIPSVIKDVDHHPCILKTQPFFTVDPSQETNQILSLLNANESFFVF